ncbi:hypothetical protein BJX70DRAFT_175957 [Aspergillus crustosus]
MQIPRHLKILVVATCKRRGRMRQPSLAFDAFVSIMVGRIALGGLPCCLASSRCEFDPPEPHLRTLGPNHLSAGLVSLFLSLYSRLGDLAQKPRPCAIRLSRLSCLDLSVPARRWMANTLVDCSRQIN